MENATINAVCQFNANFTYYACGFFAITELKYMTKPGTPNKTVATIFNEAMGKYRVYNGSNGPNDTQGMGYAQTRKLLDEDSLVWSNIRPLTNAHNSITEAIKNGHVCIVAIDETSAYDTALGYCPYTDWVPGGTHAIVVSGISATGDYVVRDSACTDQWSLRAQPRIYKASTLVIEDAIRVYPNWNVGCKEFR